MSTYYVIYHSLIFLAGLLSFVAWRKGHKRQKFLLLVLVGTLAVELLAEVLHNNKIEYVWAYHIFVVIEFSLFAAYIASSVARKKMRVMIYFIIALFIVFSLLTSHFLYNFNAFPAMNINMAGIMLLGLCTYQLFNLDANENIPVFLHADFWIYVGIVIFFGGTFFFNAIYTSLLKLDIKKTVELFGIINKPLNIAMYSFIIIGLICLLQKKKYTMQ